MPEFKSPDHLIGIAVPPDFAAVIVEAAAKSGNTFIDELLKLAIDGAEHRRLCRK